MQDLIDFAVNALNAQQEVGHRMAQHRAKDVLLDSSLSIT
jgi:hypothetical protein